MQGGSFGIGYGLKYQACTSDSLNLFTFSWPSRVVLFLTLGYVQARCISDVKADTDHTSFLAGTLSLKEENEVRRVVCLRSVGAIFVIGSGFARLDQVHLLRLSSDGTELVCEGLFSHPNEIWDLRSCPFDQRIFSSVFSSGNSLICYGGIWKLSLMLPSNAESIKSVASANFAMSPSYFRLRRNV